MNIFYLLIGLAWLGCSMLWAHTGGMKFCMGDRGQAALASFVLAPLHCATGVLFLLTAAGAFG